MAIKRISLTLFSAVTSLVVAGSALGLAQQQSAMAKDQSILDRIAAEREATGPVDPAWSPDGSSVSFVVKQSLTTGRGGDLSSFEIRSADMAGGREKVLASDSDLRAAFREQRPPQLGDDESLAALRQFRGYRWAPDGKALLLATGASLAWFELDSHASHSLAIGTDPLGDPQIAPTGRIVSFIHDHTLSLVNVEAGASRAFSKPGNEDLFEGEPDWTYRNELGMNSAYWWSPDGSSIAWLEIDDHAVDKYAIRKADGSEEKIAYPKPGEAIPSVRLFVRAVADGKPFQMDLGPDSNVYIPRVMWLPDGKHLAVERLSRDQKTLELLIADATTGQTHTILADKDVYWINLSDQLYFFKDSKRFIWSSERTGFRHLYLYDISGHQLAQLTHGDWEVTSLTGVDESTGTVYFTSTEASPIERQLYRVSLNGSAPARITRETGTHEPQLSPRRNLFLDHRSSHAFRPRWRLLNTDGSSIRELGDPVSKSEIPDLLPGSFEFLTVKTHMGLDLNAWMMKPADFNPNKQYPVIFYVAGGPGEQVVRDMWGGDIGMWFASMTQKGYIIFALDGRGTAGRGHLFEEPLHLRFGATEVADFRDGVLYLHSKPWVDKKRIGICGWGFGGFLAVHGMLDRPLLFKAGFAGSPITDWRFYDAVFAERYLENPQRNQDGWLSSSPVENAKYFKGSLLLAQATLDPREHIENTMTLQDELLDHGKYADILMFADRQSLFDDRKTRRVLFGKLTEFFAGNL
jgi:dipeptidyl-peptidase-4